VCLRFVQRFATLADVKALSADQLDQALRECGLARGDLRRKILEKVKRVEPVSVTDPLILQVRHQEVCDLAAVILQGLEHVQKGEERLEQLLATHPDADLWGAVPGGLDLHTRLLRHFGDHRERFIDYRHAQQYAGTCPVTIQSGKSKRVVLRRACNRAFRQTIVQLARHSVSRTGNCLWARQAFAKYRRNGCSAHDAYRRVANHWIRILFTCWKNHTPYDEQRHLADITAHQLRHDLGRKQRKPKEACKISNTVLSS
jgi:transposase